ncbi:hypothetical protein Mgra_00004128 [Meloidogyne graminicola]|uniref:Uncharacterized protein n=1 Tax=Meloidogyne graminicola TaxID=189291 RepID=A0A8S9ZU68_9BILA|nr:hypothetical protein Mgra_00004128 [Meloidogyne graminicola]
MLAKKHFPINYFSFSSISKYSNIVNSTKQIQRINGLSNKSLYNNKLFILPQLRNFSAVPALSECFSSSSLFSENFPLKNEWNQRFKQIEKLQLGYDASDWIMLVQKKYSGGGKASAVDLDIASIMSEHNDHIYDLIELCYKFRHTNNSSDLFPSTEYAIFRLMLEHEDIENFMKVLNDPINYGLFPNEHCCCLYLNYFLNLNDLQSAARLAVYVMHQEMFSQPLLNFLSVQALLQFIEKDPNTFPNFEERVFPSRAATIEEEINFNEENVSIFRFPWLKTPHFDGHFDIKRTDELIGRSLELLSFNLNKCNNTILTSLIGFLGIILQGKYSKGLKEIEEIQNLVVNSTDFSILLKILGIAIPFLKNKATPKNEEKAEEFNQINLENDLKREELINLLENIYSSINNKEIKSILLWQILQNEYIPIQESIECSLMNEQNKLFKEWENKRIKLIETQTERMEINLRLDEIKKQLEEIKNKKDLLQFFENRHIWEDKALQRRILEEELDMFKKRGSLTEEEYGQTIFQMGQLLKEGKTANRALETLKLGTNPEEIKVKLTSRPEKKK